MLVTPGVSDAVGVLWGLRIYISNKYMLMCCRHLQYKYTIVTISPNITLSERQGPSAIRRAMKKTKESRN